MYRLRVTQRAHSAYMEVLQQELSQVTQSLRPVTDYSSLVEHQKNTAKIMTVQDQMFRDKEERQKSMIVWLEFDRLKRAAKKILWIERICGTHPGITRLKNLVN